MKRINKFLITITSIFLLAGCSSKEAEVELPEPKSAYDLIENVRNNTEEKTESSNKGSLITKNNEIKTVAEDRRPESEKTKEEIKKPSNKQTITIKAIGDIMANTGQIQYAYYKGEGSYDFSESFMYVEDFINSSDLSIGSLYATTNPDMEYKGHPTYNAPPSYIEAIGNTGLDIINTANAHALDTGIEGLETTIATIEENNMNALGTYNSESQKIIYKTIGDIKLAFIAYANNMNGLEESNGNISIFDQTTVEADIKKAKTKGADFVIVCAEWGDKMSSNPSRTQIDLGRRMIDWGADVVIGNNPDVIQPYEWHETEDGRNGFIAYALGNFISYQNLESTGSQRTEQAVAYEFRLSKDKVDGATAIDEVGVYPIWVGTSYNDYGGSIRTYLAEDVLSNGKYASEVDEYQRTRAKQAYDQVIETLDAEVNY